MPDAHDILLSVHVAAGCAGLVLGPLAMWSERGLTHRSRAGGGYHAAVLAVALTAAGLVALNPSALWWLAPLAALSYALALLGVLAPRWRRRGWVRAYAHGQGGSYIALVTALLVVSLDGPASAAGWVLPTLVGLPLIERRVDRLSTAVARAERRAGDRTEPAPLGG
ncbi:MAG: hypothetical protein M3296_10745 [Actinomycetota bacterium]|nr:hypothetical protein [Actinomycetota bacterium]